MDISDQQIKQLPAGTAPHSFLPLNYAHAVDSFASNFPHCNALQPSLLLSSSDMNDHISGLNKVYDSTAAAQMSLPRIMYNPGNNMSMASIGAGLDQIPGLFKATYDYSFNQIYSDHAHMLNIDAGAEPHLDSLGRSTDHHQNHKLGEAPTDHNSVAKGTVLLSGRSGRTFASHEASHEDARSPVEYTTLKAAKPEPDRDPLTSGPSSLMSSLPSYPSGSSTGTSFFHGLGDMEDPFFDHRRSAFDHIDAVASTSSSAFDHHQHHFFDFSNMPSFSVKDSSTSIISSHQSTKKNSVHGSNERKTSSDNKVSCTHVGNEATTPTRCKATQQTAPKRRSYYKCSSVKGCTARKQVERNPSDPLSIIITYTVEHSHVGTTSSAAADQPNTPKGVLEEEEEDDDEDIDTDKQSFQIDKHTIICSEGADAVSEESGGLEGCTLHHHEYIHTEENMITESAHDLDDHRFECPLIGADHHMDDHQRVSGMHDLARGLVDSSTGSDGAGSTSPMGLMIASGHYHASLKKTLSPAHDHKAKAEEDVFSQLDELPGSLGSNQVWPRESADQEGIINISPISSQLPIDPFDLYNWA